MSLRKKPAVIVPFEDHDGRWRWRIRSWNGRVIATSGEAFDSYYNAQRAVDMILTIRLIPGSKPHTRIKDRTPS